MQVFENCVLGLMVYDIIVSSAKFLMSFKQQTRSSNEKCCVGWLGNLRGCENVQG